MLPKWPQFGLLKLSERFIGVCFYVNQIRFVLVVEHFTLKIGDQSPREFARGLLLSFTQCSFASFTFGVGFILVTFLYDESIKARWVTIVEPKL